MSKGIKKITKIAGWFLLILALIPLLLYSALQNATIQKFLVDNITNEISKNLHTTFTIKSVHYSLFNHLILEDAILLDQHNDTMIRANTIDVTVRYISFSSHKLRLGKIRLNEPFINAYKDTSGILNSKFLTDRLATKDTTKSTWKITCRNLDIINARMDFKTDDHQKPLMMNFQDLSIAGFNLKLSDFKNEPSETSFFIRKLSFREKCGFVLNDFSSRATISNTQIGLTNLKVQTKDSKVLLQQMNLDFHSFKDFSKERFLQNVKFTLHFVDSKIGLKDLSYFLPGFKNYKTQFNLSGKVIGKVSSFKGNDINLSFGESTKIQGDFNISGLPKIAETYIHVNLKSMVTKVKDIERIELPNQQAIKLPENIEKLGRISYRGKFTGFVNDFVAYGILNTEMGRISTDLLIKPDKGKGIRFTGKLKTDNFALGKTLGQEAWLGNITMNLNVDGQVDTQEKVQGFLQGNIASITVKGYTYKNIALSGKMSGKTYDGSLEISDPNANLWFNGKLNFASTIPEFNFQAKMSDVHLAKLHLDKNDSLSRASLEITANFKGLTPDDLEGELKIGNSLIQRHGKDLKIDSLKITSSKLNGQKRMTIKSDFMDGTIEGQYTFSQIKSTFNQYISKFIPSYQHEKEKLNGTPDNFGFSFHLKDTKAITSVLFPNVSIANNSVLSGSVNPSKKHLQLTIASNRIGYKSTTLNNVLLSAASNDSLLSVTLTSHLLSLNKNKLNFNNFSLSNSVSHNIADINIRWNSYDTIKNKGNLSSTVAFRKLPNRNDLQTIISINPASIYINDTLWTIGKGFVLIDSSRISINNVKFSTKQETIGLNGNISRSEGDSLHLALNNFNLHRVNNLVNFNGLRFDGNVNGSASFSNMYKNMSFEANLNIDSLGINNERVGNTKVNASWDHLNNLIQLELIAKRGNIKTIIAQGNYIPTSKSLNLNIEVNKTRLSIINPYIQKILTNMNGNATGNIKISGTLDKIRLDADLNVQKGSFVVNFLKTRYSVTSNMKIENNCIIFDNVECNDDFGNKAIVNGRINSKYLKDFSLNLDIRANNFMALNTTEKDNGVFYGKAFSSGYVTIKGSVKSILMTISAKTEKNTNISIPLYNKAGVTESGFLTFVTSKNDTIQKEKNKIMIDLSGIQLVFNLEVTPDAEAQLIFDSKIGDIIRGRGHGNITMGIDTHGKFTMTGDYTIDEGDYLFTLQNVINKKFIIENGGVITWTGSPTDATVNLKGIYKLKTSLYELLVIADEKYKKRIPVECQLFLSERLMNPNLKFKIELPNSTQETKNEVDNAINSEEELNRQFLALLVLNSFLPDPNKIASTSDTKPSTYTSLGASTVGITTSAEFLSNQMSRWLSQLNKEVDIGINYRPGDEITSKQLGVALSTQLLNDRVSINGNVDVGGNKTTTSTSNNYISPDFDVDVKISKNGKLRAKAFNRVNDRYIYETSPNTQGVGLSYKEEFNNWKDLMYQYWKKIFHNKSNDTINKQENQLNRHTKNDTNTFVNKGIPRR
jgi:hypothetical protein